MKIELQTKGTEVTLCLEGRLDVTWAEHVMSRALEVLRGGHHHLLLDAAGVSYLSSAGIRFLIRLRREVAAVQGTFRVVRPSPFVEQALRLSGLESLLAEPEPAAADAAGLADLPPARPLAEVAAGMEVDVYALPEAGRMTLQTPAGWIPWQPVRDEAIRKVAFPRGCTGLGIGSADATIAETRSRAGEFMAVSGCLIMQPADEQVHPPDFLTQAGGFIPEIQALQALVAEGSFSTLLRFRPARDPASLGLADLADAVLRSVSADAAVLVVLAEAEGLVGAALARSPGLMQPDRPPGEFPAIREWMNFCGERVHEGQTALAVGFVARSGRAGPLSPHLASVPSRPGLVLHSHAAVFPFRPLPEGRIDLDAQVQALFEARDPVDLLHLLDDARPLTGLGQSAFVRGACWCAPLAAAPEGRP